MRLSHHFNPRITKDLAHKSAGQASRVIAMRGNSGQEFSHHFFGGDEQSVGTVRREGGLGPSITRNEDGKPINCISEDLPHRFGVP
jgi:hypothetical protein